MTSENTEGTHAVAPRAAFEYAPAPESRAVVDIKSSYGLFVNGVLQNVIRWNDSRKPPSLFDFGSHISSVNDYAISPLNIRVER